MKRYKCVLVVILLNICGVYMVNALSLIEIKESGKYLYGEGYGETPNEASNQALSMLISQISVTVQNDVKISKKASISDKNQSVESSFKDVVSTYSQATLVETDFMEIPEKKGYHIVRYLAKTQMDRIFTGRKNRIIELLENAESLEHKRKIGDALKNYYWANILLQTLPYPNELTYEFNDKKRILSSWIPFRMNTVFDNLRAEILGVNDMDETEMRWYYKNQLVDNISYTYFDGISWSNICCARDGLGFLELPQGNLLDRVEVHVEYVFESEAKNDGVLKPIISHVSPAYFRKSELILPIHKGQHVTKNESNVDKKSQYASMEQDYTNTLQSVESHLDDYESIVNTVLKDVVARKTSVTADYFTSNGLEVYSQLIKRGHASLLGDTKLSFCQQGDFVYCRGIHMKFSFANSNRQVVEEVVFTLNKDYKIVDIQFGLGTVACQEILKKPNLSKEAKFAIIHFLETYKTAYALKRLNFVSSVFADDAVIIIGSIYKCQKTQDNYALNNQEVVKFTQLDKKQYIKRLRSVFRSNDFINICFENNDIVQTNLGEAMYGIQIRQSYSSSHYSDNGYLFLLVDVKDPQAPIIHVRTWQEKKDSKYGIIGIYDFM